MSAPIPDDVRRRGWGTERHCDEPHQRDQVDDLEGRPDYLEGHLNARHSYRLTDLMGLNQDDLEWLHNFEHDQLDELTGLAAAQTDTNPAPGTVASLIGYLSGLPGDALVLLRGQYCDFVPVSDIKHIVHWDGTHLTIGERP